MRKASRVFDLYKNHGLSYALSESKKYIISNILSRTKGGISTRRNVQKIAQLLRPLYNLVFRARFGSASNFLDEDWDNLIILDSCRYDDFKELNTISGNLEYRISPGSDSYQFMKNLFNNSDLHGTVYVTANPHIKFVDENTFYDVVTDPIANWNPDYQCVLPQSVTKAALRSHEKFPSKRLIIHYMQPHDPPIGPSTDELPDEVKIGGPAPPGEDSDGIRLMEAVANGYMSEKEARKLYRENLKIVLNNVKYLLDNIYGKTIITADHGELFGEQPYPGIGKLYGHFNHPRTIELCKVPWLITNYEKRKNIKKESPLDSNNDSIGNEIESQLEALGYQ